MYPHTRRRPHRRHRPQFVTESEPYDWSVEEVPDMPTDKTDTTGQRVATAGALAIVVPVILTIAGVLCAVGYRIVLAVWPS
jgi:hypothetical protein